MKYALVNENAPNAMRLQSIGVVQGTPAQQVKAGDFLMWNFGGVYKVNAILRETKAFVIISTSPKDEPGKVYEQKLGKSRLVCILR